VPVNLAGVVRPGHNCGRFQQVFCGQDDSTTEASALEESPGCAIVVGVGIGVVGLGVVGAFLYWKRWQILDALCDRIARLVGVLEAVLQGTIQQPDIPC
ncbi:unnamed protein product, partial [Allacma fusca]